MTERLRYVCQIDLPTTKMITSCLSTTVQYVESRQSEDSELDMLPRTRIVWGTLKTEEGEDSNARLIRSFEVDGQSKRFRAPLILRGLHDQTAEVARIVKRIRDGNGHEGRR
jgi:hypothetical protein